jgi:hypothetical protein
MKRTSCLLLAVLASTASCGGAVSAASDAGGASVPWAPGVDAGPAVCAATCPGACVGHRCVVTYSVAPAQGGDDIAVDSTSVYWTSQTANTVMKAPIAGGTLVTLTSGSLAMGLAVDATSVYFTRGPGPYPLVGRMSLDGGPVATISCCDDNMHGPIVVSSTRAFWMAETLFSDGLDGGTAVNMVPNAGGGIALAGSNVLTSIQGVNSGAIVSLPQSGGTAVTLATTAQSMSPMAVAADDTSVYWLAGGPFTGDNAPGIVAKTPLAGGTTVTLASMQASFGTPYGIAVGSGYAYFVTQTSLNTNGPSSGAIMKVPTGGGSAVTVMALADLPVAIAIDATSVYWISPSGVFRATPK